MAHIVEASLSGTVPGGPLARAQLLACQAALCAAAGRSQDARTALTGQASACLLACLATLCCTIAVCAQTTARLDGAGLTVVGVLAVSGLAGLSAFCWIAACCDWQLGWQRNC